MILLKIDLKQKTPVYQQIINGIINLIENETLSIGAQLPATRQLSDRLGVNRTTVYRAYQELLALGYVDSRPGSYTTVRKRAPIVAASQSEQRSHINWRKISTPASQQLHQKYLNHFPEYEIARSPEVINFSKLYVEEQLFPADDFRRCLNYEQVNRGKKLFHYGEVAGYQPLREAIAQRMQSHGITVASDDILITNGAQQGFELIVKLLTTPATPVVIEAPTYANIIPLLQYHQTSIIEVPMRDDGMDLNQLEAALAKEHPALIYTMPNFHNPTGITTSQAHRERLLLLSARFRVPIVEDGFEEELKYFGKVVLPIKSMDRHQTVIYVGTVSKVLFPGLRIGWIAAHRECIKRLTAIKRFCDLSGNVLVQAAMAHFFRQDYYDKHVKRMHRIYRRRMTIALTAMKECFPPEVTWTKPDGGYTFWITLPKPYKNQKLLKAMMLKHRVLVSPGNYYFHGSSPKKYFRISIANLSEEKIREGIFRLSKLVKELIGNRA